jgi:hypothetical protein
MLCLTQFRSDPIGVSLILGTQISRSPCVTAFSIGRRGFPGIAIRPAIIKMLDFTWGCDRFKCGQRVVHDCTLITWIKWPPDGVTERIIDEYTTRRPACFENIERAPDYNGRNAVGFKVSRYQTPGLMADGSHRNQ